MRKYTFTDGGYTFQRIDKKAAWRAYNNGLRVMLCPVNLRPGYPYHPETSISGKAAATFDEALNAFEFYNLRGKETGHYTAFYIPVREVDRFTGEAPTAATLETVTQEDYNNSILANGSEWANFAEWYGDATAKVLVIILSDANTGSGDGE